MKTCVTAVVVLMFLASMAAAQGRSPNFTGAGARAAGMGNAFIGLADDATAVVWNPAGLTQLERLEASVVGRFVWETTEYSEPATPKNNTKESQDHPVFNFGSFAIPFDIGESKLVIAAAYQRQLDFYNKSVDATMSFEETGGADAVSPGVAFGFGSIFSVGFVTNIWFGNDLVEMSIISPKQKYTYEGTPSGLNFLGGLLVDLNGLKKPIPIKFGASVRTPFDLKFDYTLKADPAIQGISKVDVSQTTQIPTMFGFGASGRPTENLTIAVDYELRDFSDALTIEQVKVPGAAAATPDTSNITQGKNDLNQFRAGIEYLIVMRGGVIPVRLGYKTVPTVFADEEMTSSDPKTRYKDQVIGKGFSVGTGFIGGTFALDFGFSYTTWEKKFMRSGKEYATTSFTESMLTGSVIVYF